MRLISLTYFLVLTLLFASILPDNSNQKREIASIFGSNCFDHANAIIFNDSWYNRSLTKLMRERSELAEYYKYYKNAIDDFDNVRSMANNAQLKLLKDGETSLAAKIGLIRKAKSTLDISYYIFQDDEIGNIMINELRKAVARGVHVRVLVDSTTALNSSLYSDQFKSLIKFKGPKGIPGTNKRIGSAEVVVFNNIMNPRKTISRYVNSIRNLFRDESNQIPISDSTINRRLHDKIILMDAEDPKNSMAIIGGRNIANEYHTLDSFKGESFEFEDMDVLIRDTKDIKKRTEKYSLTTKMQNYYDKLYFHIGNNNLANAIVWLSRTNYKKEVAKMSRISRKTFKENPRFKAKLDDMLENGFFEEGFDSGLVRVLNEIQNIHSPWGRIKYEKVSDVNPNSISKELWNKIQIADYTIDIVTPYAHLTDQEIAFIQNWLLDDPNRRFRLITSSLSTNDTLASQALIDNSLMPKLFSNPNVNKDQIQVYYYGKEDDVFFGGDKKYGKLHAKYAVFDDQDSIIMTSNLDPRSRSLNSEIGVSIDTAKLNSKIASELTESTEDLINRSHLYGSEEWNRINNHENLKWKRIFSKLMYLIIDTFNLERNI